MKKVIFILSIFVLCFSSCKKNNIFVSENITEVEETKEEKSETGNTQEIKSFTVTKTVEQDGYQNTDPMRSDYAESDSDGYSWRYRDCTYEKTDSVLSKEKLLSTAWYMDDAVNQYYVLCFYTDGKFKAGTRQAGVDYIGTYEVRDGKVYMKTLESYDIGILGYFPGPGQEYTGVFHPYSDSVLYDHELVVDGYRFFPGNCYKENGSDAVLQSIPVIVERRRAIVNDNVKLRSGPGITYEQLHCERTSAMVSEMFNVSSIKKPAPLITGSDFSIIARTVEKDNIKGDEAYWYYILYSDGFESVYYGWIFGAWIENYEEDLSALYWNMTYEGIKEKYNLYDYEP